jgi:O-antigen/teichoic acid export membrane protein
MNNDQSKLAVEEVVIVAPAGKEQDGVFKKISAEQLKGTSVRGGVVATISQGLRFILQTGSVIILARLLKPEDFGIQGMVVAMTGFVALFKDAGLGMATVQRGEIAHEQISTLFWINVWIGAILAVLVAALAPALVAFYHEPRLFWVTIVMATTFLIGGFGMQHGALLQRSMRFVTMAKIDVLTLAVSSMVGIVMAALGCGYWSLVIMTLVGSLFNVMALFLVVRWFPGKPSRGRGVRKMLHFGGTITLNNLVVYVAYNADKVLLGRFLGGVALGLYGRAYQLVNLPLQQLSNSIFIVAFPALSRIQDDNERLCRSFLKGFSILLSVNLPITIVTALFADEIIVVLLGAKWNEAGPILRLLTPAILGFALMNPFGWFLMATGRAARSLKISYLVAPTMLLGIIIGLHYGLNGVALGYSAAVVLLVVPVIAWSIRGTGITSKAFWENVRRPLLAGLLAVVVGLIFKIAFDNLLPPLPRLILGVVLVLGLYAWILLGVLGQKDLYVDLVQQVLKRKRPN